MNNNETTILRYIAMSELSKDRLYSFGISEAIQEQLNLHGAHLKDIYINESDWAFPIVYFNQELGFEFRFTPFQNDWSDRQQLLRFMQVKAKILKEKNTSVPTTQTLLC